MASSYPVGRRVERRALPRFAPGRLVTASIQGQDVPAYGLVFNLSRSGACLVADRLFSVGSHLRVGLSFHRDPRLFEARADVMWSQQDRRAVGGVGGAFLHGMEFTDLSEEKLRVLNQMLDTLRSRRGQPSDGRSTRQQSDFERLRRDIEPDLAKLAAALERLLHPEE